MKCSIARWQQEISRFHAVASVEQSAGPGKPAACFRRFAAQQQGEAKPKCAARCARLVPGAQESLMRACKNIPTFFFLSDQESGLGELKEIFWFERQVMVGCRELQEGIPPGLLLKRLAALLDRLCAGS